MFVCLPSTLAVNKHIYIFAKLEQKLQKIHKAARENLKEGQRHQRKQYNRKAHAKKWKAGILVWFFNPTKKIGRSPRLQLK